MSAHIATPALQTQWDFFVFFFLFLLFLLYSLYLRLYKHKATPCPTAPGRARAHLNLTSRDGRRTEVRALPGCLTPLNKMYKETHPTSFSPQGIAASQPLPNSLHTVIEHVDAFAILLSTPRRDPRQIQHIKNKHKKMLDALVVPGQRQKAGSPHKTASRS
ncbi:hypothetical protein LY78DRAFT_316035 [Colletotrichum sublineola]|nr:hypothetical protein LY78DRAFT_316035 [Colletotrichum sublineola]